MKKSLITLAVSSFFSATSSFAAYVDFTTAKEAQDQINPNDKTGVIIIGEGNSQEAIYFEKFDDGTYKFTQYVGNKDVEVKLTKGDDGSLLINGRNHIKKFEGNDAINYTPERNNDQNNYDTEREKAKAKAEAERKEWELKEAQKRRDNGSMNDQNNHDAEREKAIEEAERQRKEWEFKEAQKRRDNASKNDQGNHDDARTADKAAGLEKAIDYAIDANKDVVVDGVKYSGQDLLNAKNTLSSMSKEERAAVIKELEKNGANADVKIVDGNNDRPNNDIIERDTVISAAATWADQAYLDFQNEVKRLDSKIDTMEGRVSNGTAMVGAMSQMQFGADGLGMGVGVANFNGSNAISVGVGYAFGDNKEWMAKGSFGYAKSKKGKGSEDTMAAAGLTYSFK